MAIIGIFDSASSVMTVVSLLTFLGILWWTFGIKRSADFDAIAATPFADEPIPAADAAPAVVPAAGRMPPAEQPHV